jgi:uncharacterized protein YggE
LISLASAQFGGSRAGLEEQHTIGSSPFTPLSKEVAESFISIEGKAEVRVKPTELRIVLAVTAEGEAAIDCQKEVDATLAKLMAAWAKMKIPSEAIVVDFIAVLPRYEWKVGIPEENLMRERRAGFRMQSNVHLEVADDAGAMSALGVAFEHGVTDIIAFDYWSKELDSVKEQAREKALTAVRAKSDLMLKALFAEKPAVINVQEQTTVHYPASLYHSFTNTVNEEAVPTFARNYNFIRANRPKNTYYRGLFSDGDIQPRELPMKPEISVVSTVCLYFESPAAARRGKKETKK